MSDEHLTTEQISALLDRGAEEASEDDHIESCPACRREMKLLRRMRMALSALDDAEAPPAAWSSVESELERRGLVEETEAGEPIVARESRSLADVGWVRAAAAAVLFVGGLGLGTHLASPGGLAAGGESPGTTSVSRSAATGGEAPTDARVGSAREDGAGGAADDAGAGAQRLGTEGSSLAAAGREADSADGLGYREAMRRLEELRARGPSFREAYRNPRAAAEHLARLDALMSASQEALREDPADPALNDFLFQVAEERRTLNRALQLSSLEYR